MKKVNKGQRFGLLRIMKEVPSKIKELPNGKREIRRVFLCVCDCGNRKEIKLINLTQGKTRSCGCLGIDNLSQSKHGLSTHRLVPIWVSMRQRCNNENNPAYHRYGGRGIKVCEEWQNDFKAFHDWAVRGFKEGLSLDRINNNGNYEPTNCRWATRKQQANNRRVAKGRVQMDGLSCCIFKSKSQDRQVNPHDERT